MKRSLVLLTLVFFANFISCNKDEISNLEQRNEELLIQTASLQRQLNDLTKDISELLRDNENLSSDNLSLSNQIEILQNKIDELEESLNLMTNDYEQSELENNDLYDTYLSILNSKNELQAQLDNLVNEINSISCPPIELDSLSMKSEQLFCTFEQIDPIRFDYDDSAYNFSFIQDSIPNGISIIKTPGNILITGTPYSDQKDLFSFDLKFSNNQCEEVKRITLARNPNSPKITLVSGSNTQSIVAGNQIQAIEYSFSGSAQGLTFLDLPEGLSYSIDGNKYKIEGTITEVGSSSITVSTVNTSGCGELSETINIEVEQAAIPTDTGGGTPPVATPPVVTPPVQTPATQYQLTVNTSANGSVSPSGGTYNDGTSISITASPETGYEFVNWTDSSGNELSTDPTYTFNITSDTTITANYEELLFYLHPNGVTILCPNASVGAIGSVDGVQYTKVDRNSLIAKRNAGENLALVCTSGITDLNSMFRKKGNNANSLASGIGNWDTSSNTSMSRIFANGNFNQDISNWDTSNVTNMYNAFQGASSFNQDISGWDTGKVTQMRWTFRRAKRFNQDISGWDISNVDDMRGFLKDTEDFNQDLTGWNVDGVTQCDEFILNAISMTPDKIPNFTNCDPNYENPSSSSN